MALVVHQLALSTIHLLRPLLPLIQRQDKALAVQLTKAASSVVLNIAEAEYSDPGTRRSRFYSAAGSANESRAALRTAVAWGYVSERHAAKPIAELDRVVAMLWKLSRGA